MNGPRLFLLMVALAVGALGFLFLPGTDEQSAMLMREGRFKEVIQQLSQQVAQGQRQPGMLATLARAYEADDNIALMTATLELYSEAQPDDIEALDKLALAYAGTDQTGLMLEAMTKAAKLDPSERRLPKLLSLYRLHGRFELELKLLTALNSEQNIDSASLLRLGQLQAAVSDQKLAIRTLTELDSRTDIDLEPARRLLFELLLSAGQGTEAATAARGWVGAWRKPWIALELVRRLARAAKEPDVALLSARVIELHPEIRFVLVRNLAEDGQRPLARRLLAGFAAAEAGSKPELYIDFVATARLIGVPAQAFRSFTETLESGTSDANKAAFADALVMSYGPAALSPFRDRLPRSLLEKRPLLGARLAVYDRNEALTADYLGKLDLTAAPEADRRAFVDLVSHSLPHGAASDLLTRMRALGRLPAVMQPLLAGLMTEWMKSADMKSGDQLLALDR